MYAEVLIEYSAKAIDKTFTYIIPDHLLNDIKIGMKVLIPFGNKTINGFVTNITNEFNDTYELKTIVDIVDKYLVLNKEMMELGEYLQEKTLCTKIAAYQTMLQPDYYTYFLLCQYFFKFISFFCSSKLKIISNH